MSTKNSIQVGIKLRPLIGKEKGLTSCWRVVNNSIQLVDSQSEPFYFDHIFDEDVGNSAIFETMAKNIVHAAIKGFNGTIFAYGQTSSGKTYTMMGDNTNPGVMVLAAKEIFQQIVNASDRQFLLRVGYIEIYNEKIYDLLNKKNQDLKIHETNTGVSVNCEEIVITSEEDLLNILHTGNKERTVGETNMNERSSRSHAIFRITIESRKCDRSEDDTVIQSVINLVDLAGSERANQTGATGARLKEGGHINKSLLFLSNVIKNLSENEDHKYISYRDSKLTRILQASLGGNALTAIICTIKPTAIEESQSTLSFAMRAKTIKNKPLINENVSDATMMKRLENEIKHLKSCLSEERLKNQSKIKVCQLEEQIKNSLIKIISVNSLSNVRKEREARRRTWCSTSLMNTSTVAAPNREIEAKPKASAQAFFTPHITYRGKENVYVANEADIKEVDDELCDESPPKVADDCWDSCRTPKRPTIMKTIVTPKADCAVKKLQIVENALMELQELTNLENAIPVEHNTYATLKERMEILEERNANLESERLQYLEAKVHYEEELSQGELRCNQLQVQVSKLVKANGEFEGEIKQCKRDLEAMTSRIKELERENQEAVNNEFELQRHQNKYKLREAELLGALKEEGDNAARQAEILKRVQHECDTIKKQYARLEEEHSKFQGGHYQAPDEANNNLEIMKRLQEENEKLLNSYAEASKDNLRLKESVEQLENEYKKHLDSCKDTTAELSRLREESEKFAGDAATNAQLKEEYKMHLDSCKDTTAELSRLREENEKLAGDAATNAQLKEEYNSLKRSVEDSRKELAKLQEENSSLKSEVAALNQLNDEHKTLLASCEGNTNEIGQLQSEVAKLQAEIVLHNQLKSENEKLTASYENLVTEMKQLKEENNSLQTQIEAYTTLKDDYEALLSSIKSDASENEHLVSENTKLKCELETNNNLRVEYDKLMETSGEYTKEIALLKEDNEKRQAELELASKIRDEYEALVGASENHTTEILRLQEENKNLQTQVNAMNDTVARLQSEISEKSSQYEELLKECDGLSNELMDSIQEGDSLREKCQRLEEDLRSRAKPLACSALSYTEQTDMVIKLNEAFDGVYEIELRLEQERTRLYELKGRNVAQDSTSASKAYKLLLGEFDEVPNADCAIHPENTKCLVRQSKFHLIQIERSNSSADEIQEETARLQQRINELTCQNDKLREENKSLLESSEQTVQDFRDQIMRLTSELCEKSMVLEKCSCDDYQRQISFLEKERADVTMECEQLREQMDISMTARCTGDGNKQVEELRDKCLAYQTQLRELETMSAQKLATLQDELAKKEKTYKDELAKNEKTYKDELAKNEKTYKEEINRLQLEVCDKLEMNEALSRDILRKARECEESEESRRSMEHKYNLLQEQNADLLQQKELILALQLELSVSREALQTSQVALKTSQESLQTSQEALQTSQEALQTSQEKCSATENELDSLRKEKLEMIEGQKALLDEKCSLQASFDTVLSEKASLEAKLEEASRHRELLEGELSNLKEAAKELETLRSEGEVLREKCNNMQADNERVQLKMLDTLKEKEALESALNCSTATVTEYKNRLSSMEVDLTEKLNRIRELDEKIATLEADYEATVGRLRRENDDLKSCLGDQTKEKSEVAQIVETHRLQVEVLSKELHEAKNKLLQAGDLQRNYDALRQSFDELKENQLKITAERNSLQETLRESSNKLASSEQLSQSRIQCLEQQLQQHQIDLGGCKMREQNLLAQQQELEKRAKDMQVALQELQYKYASAKQSNQKLNEASAVAKQLEQQVQHLKGELSACKMREQSLLAQQREWEKRSKDIQSSLQEFQYKCSTLEQSNKQLSEANAQAQQKLIASQGTQREYERLKGEMQEATKAKQQIQQHLSNIRDELNMVKGALKEQTSANDYLRELVAKKETAFKVQVSKLEGEKANLVLQQKNLQDKYAATEMSLKLVEHELALAQHKADSANTSMESLVSNSFSPSIPDNNPSKENKIYSKRQKSLQQNQKNRRLSCHDENRPQASWDTIKDVAIMTDPIDANCNCLELDKKLKNAEKELFIRESQVAALKMEIRNHPMLTENEMLKKRLEKEEQQNLQQIRKYKDIIIEQRTKSAKQTDTVETQTEFELDSTLHKLQSKYNDIKNICRSRYNVIKKMEAEIAEMKEKASLSLSDQMKTLQVEYETANKELERYKQKYNDAKGILAVRLDEIRRLRAMAGIVEQ